MDLKQKSKLIAEFVVEYNGEEEYEDFFSYNDLGVPLAVSIANNLVDKLTEEGAKIIEETWTYLCTELEIDPSMEYEGIEDLLDLDEFMEEEEEE